MTGWLWWQNGEKRKGLFRLFINLFHVSQEYKEQRNISKSQGLKIKIRFYFPEGIFWFFNVIVSFKGIWVREKKKKKTFFINKSVRYLKSNDSVSFIWITNLLLKPSCELQ